MGQNKENKNSMNELTAAIYKLDIVRRALNGGEIPSMDSGEVYCPWVKIYNISKLPSNAENEKVQLGTWK